MVRQDFRCGERAMITYGHKNMLPVSKVEKEYGIEQSTFSAFKLNCTLPLPNKFNHSLGMRISRSPADVL
jgi:hypothetical protein